MDKKLEISVILSAVDKMSRGIDEATNKSIKKLSEFQKKADKISRNAFDVSRSLATGAVAIGAPLAYANKMYMEQESAATDLKITMMGANGEVSKSFDDLSKKAIKLGSDYIGTTADMFAMMANMKNSGMSDESILGDGAETAAMFANLNKLDYTSTSTFFAKTAKATNTAEKDYEELFDTINRGFQSFPGVPQEKMNEMEGFFATTQAGFQTLGKTGLEETKKLAILGEFFVSKGMSGSSAGTALGRVMMELADTKKYKAFKDASTSMGLDIDLLDKKTGKFDIANFVANLDKMNGLTAQQKIGLLKPLAGPEGKDLNEMLLLADLGYKGYNDFVEKQSKHADIRKQMAALRKTEAFMADTVGGNFQNSLAAFAKTMEPIFVKVIDKITAFLGMADKFMAEHPFITKTLGTTAIIAAVTLGAFSIVAAVWGASAKGAGLAAAGVRMGAKLLGFGARGTAAAASSTGKVIAGFGGKSAAAIEAAEIAAKKLTFGKALAKTAGFINVASMFYDVLSAGNTHTFDGNATEGGFSQKFKSYSGAATESSAKAVIVNYNPTINAQIQSGENDKTFYGRILKDNANEIKKLFDEATRNKQRLAF